ncbi:MAG: bifunctional metallophosphatase/5'-nucleotidase [Bacteroidales bacterium]|nr:bifunctional metallophosphatase/5'-nucleotidase [Bacteroidales bacterium]
MKRFFLVLWVGVAVLFGLNACDTVEQKPKQVTLAVLSVNDMHSAIDNMPKFAALVDSLRTVYPDLLVLSAGDNRTGNPINDQYEPTSYPMIAMMNKVGFKACTVGNHEWDGSVAGLQKNIEDADFPYLCANINISKEVKLDVKPYVIIEQQGLRIAVLGMIELRADGFPGAHPVHFKNLTFRRPEEVLPEYKFLRDQADVCIFLSHVGFEEDVEMAEKNPWLDAILGGHSHTLVEHPKKHNGVIVTQAGSSLSHATLTLFTVNNGKVTDVKATTLDVAHYGKENAEMRAMLNKFNNNSRFSEALATATTPFVRREELGCLVTDGMRWVTGADFALENTGGIRIDDLKAGPITMKDVYDIDPYGNDVVVYTMTGNQLEGFLKHSFMANGDKPSYVSGMTYSVNTDAKGKPKSVEIRPDLGRYSKNKEYKVAINSYMASTVRFESVDDGQSQFMTSEEMVIQYLREVKTVSYKGIRRTFY